MNKTKISWIVLSSPEESPLSLVESLLEQRSDVPTQVFVLESKEAMDSGEAFYRLSKRYTYFYDFCHPHCENKSVLYNLGLHHASGEYVCFLSGKEHFAKNAVTSLCHVLEQEPLDALLIAKNQGDIPLSVQYHGEGSRYFLKKYKTLKNGIPSFSIALFRRKFLLENSLWLEQKLGHKEREDLLLRALYQAKDILVLNASFVEGNEEKKEISDDVVSLWRNVVISFSKLETKEARKLCKKPSKAWMKYVSKLAFAEGKKKAEIREGIKKIYSIPFQK